MLQQQEVLIPVRISISGTLPTSPGRAEDENEADDSISLIFYLVMKFIGVLCLLLILKLETFRSFFYLVSARVIFEIQGMSIVLFGRSGVFVNHFFITTHEFPEV